MGAVVGLGLVAHGGLGGLAVEIGVIAGLVALVVAVVVQGRRETRAEKNGAAQGPPREKGEGE